MILLITLVSILGFENDFGTGKWPRYITKFFTKIFVTVNRHIILIENKNKRKEQDQVTTFAAY